MEVQFNLLKKAKQVKLYDWMPHIKKKLLYSYIFGYNIISLKISRKKIQDRKLVSKQTLAVDIKTTH